MQMKDEQMQTMTKPINKLEFDKLGEGVFVVRNAYDRPYEYFPNEPIVVEPTTVKPNRNTETGRSRL